MLAPFDVTDCRIETERLVLRPWCPSDLEDLYAYASVPGVGEMAGWVHHASMEESRAILELFIRGKKTFALELRETGHVVGSLGVEEYDEAEFDRPHLRGRELGYVLGRDCWGKGLMTEAMQAVIDHCFRVLDYDFLTCGHFERNERSRRVIEKCGFRYVKNITYDTRYHTVENSRYYVLYHPKFER